MLFPMATLPATVTLNLYIPNSNFNLNFDLNLNPHFNPKSNPKSN